MGPIQGFSVEEFKKNGTLPTAPKVESPAETPGKPKEAEKSVEPENVASQAEPKRGFFSRMFGKKEEKMPGIEGFSIEDYKRKKKEEQLANITGTPSPRQPQSQLPSNDGSDTELRLPDMLTLPDDNQLRPTEGGGNNKAPVIARPPKD